MSMTKRITATLSIALLTLIGNAPAEPKAGTTGTVSETMNGGSYTYVQLDLDGETVWYAVPATEFEIGAKVIVPGGMAMNDFHSETLDRTFDVVYFAEAIVPAGSAETTGSLPPGHPSIQPVACPAPAGATFDFSGIERPEGGKTINEIFADTAALAGKQIVVRGIAVKVTNNIMGKNWIHLQDGTGEAGSNDLTVTTTKQIEVGQTVTASGILATDLDFGYGYKYAVLLQDAAVESK